MIEISSETEEEMHVILLDLLLWRKHDTNRSLSLVFKSLHLVIILIHWICDQLLPIIISNHLLLC